MHIHRLTDELAVSGALTEADVGRLAAEGFRSIVDLRSDGEPRPRGVAPWDEARLARESGLAYRQVPVEPQLLSDGLARAVHQALRDAPAPVLLHCTTGRRAGTFGLIEFAREQDLSVGRLPRPRPHARARLGRHAAPRDVPARLRRAPRPALSRRRRRAGPERHPLLAAPS